MSLASMPHGVETQSHGLLAQARARIACGISVVRRDSNPHRKTAILIEHLGKTGVLRARHLDDLRAAFSELIPVRPTTVCALGLAESGIVPAFAVATLAARYGHQVEYHCSTRLPQSRSTHGVFSEEHSHAPQHYLPSIDPDLEEIWVVEDELTTGQTLLNLLSQIPRGSARKKHCVRIFSILDLRSRMDMQRFGDALVGLNVRVLSCDSLFVPSEIAKCRCKMLLGKHDAGPDERPSGETRYVVGEQVRCMLPWLDEDTDDSRGLRQFTLSPWSVDGNRIQNRQQIGGHYLYNVRPQEELNLASIYANCISEEGILECPTMASR